MAQVSKTAGRAAARPNKSKDIESKYPTDAQMRKEGMDVLSARIRHLASLGAPTAEIAKIVCRENGEHPKYQHVRNVLKQPFKGAGGGGTSGNQAQNPSHAA